jgi:hypothetical protein
MNLNLSNIFENNLNAFLHEKTKHFYASKRILI